MSEDRLIDEGALRRALRLDPDERPARLDVAALRAIVARSAIDPSAGLAIALVAGTIALVASVNVVDVLVRTATIAAPLASTIWALVSQPSTPLAILAAVIVALAYERRLEREESYAASS